MVKKLFDVFMSYNSKDREAAATLDSALRKAGLNVWFDQRELRPGGSWQDRLEIEIGKASSVAVLIGPSGIGPWQAPEVRKALSQYMKEGHPVIPVILPGVEKPELPAFLDQHVWVDCRAQQMSQEGLDRLIWGISGRRRTTSLSQIGEEFFLTLQDLYGREKILRLNTLPNPNNESLLDLTWETFGRGIEILKDQIRSLGSRLGVDACFGINDAGLVMATFINSAILDRVRLGHLKCGKAGGETVLLDDSIFPPLDARPTIMLFDFEIKHSNGLRMSLDELRARYDAPRFYLAVFGAMTESTDLKISDLSELISAKNLATLDLEDVFIACTMHPPGIEPPLGLR